MSEAIDAVPIHAIRLNVVSTAGGLSWAVDERSPFIEKLKDAPEYRRIKSRTRRAVKMARSCLRNIERFFSMMGAMVTHETTIAEFEVWITNTGNFRIIANVPAVADHIPGLSQAVEEISNKILQEVTA